MYTPKKHFSQLTKNAWAIALHFESSNFDKKTSGVSNKTIYWKNKVIFIKL